MSRVVGEDFKWRFVGEASQSRLIVCIHEVEDIAIALVVAFEAAVLSTARFWFFGEVLRDAPVEAFDETVGLRTIGPGELMADAALRAQQVDGVAARRFAGGLVLFVVGEAVGPFAAIVGENGVHLAGETIEKAVDEGARGGGLAVGQDLGMDIARGAVDGDEDVGRFAVQPGEVLNVEMDEAERPVGLEASRFVCFGWRGFGDAVAPQCAVDGAARQLGVHTAMHHLDDVIQGQGHAFAIPFEPVLEHQNRVRLATPFTDQPHPRFHADRGVY